MIHRAKKEGFGHLLESGLLDWLDIAYCASTKCLPTFGNVTRSWRIIQRSQKCIFEWSKEPKKRFLAIFLSLVCWIDLILHIVIVLNVFPSRQCYQVRKDHSNITKMHFWMIHRAKSEVFGHLIQIDPLDWLHFAYFDSAKQSLRFDHVISQSVYNYYA